ncbi:hypothetical protein C265_16835 [Cupriavidus sp. GA3-3]|nr:hypothetical protein C265_16835 [Cupriavidus sp. GA3-3]
MAKSSPISCVLVAVARRCHHAAHVTVPPRISVRTVIVRLPVMSAWPRAPSTRLMMVRQRNSKETDGMDTAAAGVDAASLRIAVIAKTAIAQSAAIHSP